ncbi:MAG TPA: tRNA-uridine aminocarboxypropyltransferase [Nannocystaceae bacterium]|nr:tRNA-uridine aminocarboxypropyltransferase [Nannocystaceae bacterium]
MTYTAGVLPESTEPRAVCMRCRRPQSVCWCRHLTSIPTRTRITFLQHPRERSVAIGTARMASLCLPNSELHVGIEWDDSAALARALGDPARPAALLYPAEHAIDIVKDPPRGPITLVVVDGTWRQARKIVQSNPRLAALPRYAFVPPSPSEYRIRREPKDSYVSTIEALVHVLGALEGDRARFEPLLTPFRAMVDTQLEHIRRRHSPRKHRTPREDRKRRIVPAFLHERFDDVVCVVGETNTWPYGSELHRAHGAGDLVHWVACRPSTGEVFDRVIAPSTPLAPQTPTNIGVTREALLAGCTRAEFLADWHAFLRERDIVCSWGHYARNVLVAAGGRLPPARVEMRSIARMLAGRSVGALEDHHARLGVAAISEPARARRRLAMAIGVARHLATL